jgi:hypothetical protein
MSARSNRLAALASSIRAAHEQARRSAGEAMEQAFEAGRLLLQARAQIDRSWERWVAENLPFGVRQAERYIRAWRHATVIREAATSKSGLKIEARFSLEKVLASIALPESDRAEPEDKGTSRRGKPVPSNAAALERQLAVFTFDPEEEAKAARDPARLRGAAWPAYERLRGLINALDRRLVAESRRTATALQPAPFDGATEKEPLQ